MPPRPRRPTGRPPAPSRLARRRPQARPAGPWKHGPIPVIGVVGGIGAGKSAVAAVLGELGAFVIDADRVGHALLNQRPVRERVVARFGQGVLAPPSDPAAAEPEVDRRALGRIVFSDPNALRDLEAIVHPRMRATFTKAIARTVRRGRAKAVVLDAAILYKAGWDRLCDQVVYVDAPRPERLARLAAQRGWTEEALGARERAQAPAEETKRRADVVVTNDAGPESLRPAVERAFRAVLASPPSRPRADADADADRRDRDRDRPPFGRPPGPPGRNRPRGR